MKVLHSIEELSELEGPVVLAAGTFDGLHLGHQALIRRAMEEAASCGGMAVVLTFDRHPASLLRPEISPKILTRNNAKTAMLESMGVPALLMLEFTRDLAAVPAREFIASLASNCRRLRAVCVGIQWSFGRGGEGNVALLRENALQDGFSVIQILPVEAGGSPISSTRVRKSINQGDLADASRCLGRPFLLTGTVTTGAGLGATIGFPTANLEISGMQLPPDGVYAVKVRRDGSEFTGVCNIGLRPTVESSGTHRTVEVHLFDVSEDLVGKELSVEFVKFLRGEQKFSGLEELTVQIGKDCVEARRILVP